MKEKEKEIKSVAPVVVEAPKPVEIVVEAPKPVEKVVEKPKAVVKPVEKKVEVKKEEKVDTVQNDKVQ